MAVRLETRLRGLGVAVLTACLAILVCGPAAAGPIGAIGDVYTAGDNGDGTESIYQYDGVTGAKVGLFTPYGGAGIGGMAWGPDGNLYAISGISPTRWNLTKIDGNTGAKLGNVISYNDPNAFSAAKGIAFGPDGDLYLGDWYQNRIDRYEFGSFALKASYEAVAGDGMGTPNFMTWAPNGHLMVVSGGWNSVLEFDTANDDVDLLGVFSTMPGVQQPQDLAFGPNGNLFVTGGYMGNVVELDGTTGAYIGDFVSTEPGRLSATSLLFDDHGRLLLTSSETGGARVLAYDAITGAPLGAFTEPGNGGYLTIKPAPEPASLVLLVLGGFLLRRR
jgi:WD40 repeat protein